MIKSQFKYFIDRIGGCDMRQFLKASVKAVISDDLAVDLTWRGTATKPSIQKFAVFNIIKDICHVKYKIASSYEINKFTQQQFLHAKDRVSKKQ
ncbi:uncharacterized protein LOC124419251, partial [Lucilia cuprina]|uniref:uncharacterized protein LOC124419251 n=1 Tax=Lucilia cuprina TaxID=7375 RepID=UPI001F07043B